MNLDATVLAQIRHELPSIREVEWEEPPALRARGPQKAPLVTIFPLLRLVPGLWLRLGPLTSGSYSKLAKEHGIECTQRFEDDGALYLYFRAPEVEE